MSKYDTSIDWPERFERTPPGRRTRSSQFSASMGDTTKEIAAEMDRLGADNWKASIGNGHTKTNGLPRHNANPDDPGFVLRWQKGGTDYAVACDQYAKLRDNVRAVYLWLNETRMRSKRPVETGQDSFAAAALPSGDGGAGSNGATALGDGSLSKPPHEVLGVQPDAADVVVEAAFDSLRPEKHPDTPGGSKEEFIRLKKAKEAMLDE